jgi:hypothetical protein
MFTRLHGSHTVRRKTWEFPTREPQIWPSSSHFTLSFPHTYSKDYRDMWQFCRGRNIGSMNLNLYISAKQSHIIFYSEMATCSGLKRPSSGHHYRSSKIRHYSVKIKLVIWDLTWQKFIQNSIKILELVTPRPLILSNLCTKNVNYKYIIIKMLKWDFEVFKKLLLSHKCWPRDVKIFENLHNFYAEFIDRQ